MIVIRPTCRLQFTETDIAFILDVLCKSDSQRESVLRLLADPDTRDQILDQQKLLDAVLGDPGCLHISSRLYFYLLVRKVFLDAGIRDAATADYVAEMLTVFSQTHRMRNPLGNEKEALDYLVDVVQAMETMDDRGKFVRVRITLNVNNGWRFCQLYSEGFICRQTESM